MNKFHFGQNLKAIRLSKNITQDQMAFRLGIPQRTYSRIEDKPNPPNGRRVSELAKAVGVSPGELLPDFKALETQDLSKQQGYGKSNPVAEFLMTYFGKFTYIVLCAIVFNIVYTATKSFCDEWGTSPATMVIVGYLMVIIMIGVFYYSWRRLTRATR
jgi:transcriptional regulator with XRE-family HTH domain